MRHYQISSVVVLALVLNLPFTSSLLANEPDQSVDVETELLPSHEASTDQGPKDATQQNPYESLWLELICRKYSCDLYQ